MNRDLIIKRMKRVAHDISDLANDINNNKHRVHFFSDIIKQRIFELYDLNQSLTEDAEGADLGHSQEANVTPTPRVLEHTVSKERFLKTHQTDDRNSEKTISEEKHPSSNISELDRVITHDVNPQTNPVDVIPPSQEVMNRETPTPLPSPPPENPIITTPPIEDTEMVKEISTTPPPTDDSLTGSSDPMTPIEENNPMALPPTLSGHCVLKNLLDQYVDSRNQLNDITQRLQNAPISNFSTAISIGQKHEFINGLFGGNAEKYKTALQQIENKASLELAIEWLEREFLHQYHWDRKEKLTTSFLFLIRRRFL
jgi:hypothetical protein